MSNRVLTQAERITSLEVQLATLQQTMSTHVDETSKRHDIMNGKLDELLGLRNKGIGAFWLASALAGTGIIGLAVSFIDWMRSAVHG